MEEATLLDLQNIILGSMIVYPDTVGPALAELTDGDFTTDGTQAIWTAIRQLHGQGAPINTYSLTAELGQGYAREIAMVQLVATRDPGYYVGKLKEVARLTALQAEGLRLAESEDADAAAQTVSRINEISSARRGVRITPVGGAIRGYLDGLGQGAPKFIKTGLRIFDEEAMLRKGRYFVIGGYPSSGKTLLTIQMALYMGQANRIGFFSFETDDRDIAVRALSAMTGVQNQKVQRHDLNAADRAALETAAGQAEHLKLELIQANGMTAEDIRAVTLSRKYDVIFVDYLQLVAGANPRATGYERVSGVSRTLQGLSRTGEVLVVALSQLSRPEPRKDGKLVPPNMTSLRESGQIEQDADVIALLYPEDMDDNRSSRILKVAKNKDGEKLALELSFDGGTQRMQVKGLAKRKAPAVRQAGDGSGWIRYPEGRGPQPPEDLVKQERMAF